MAYPTRLLNDHETIALDLHPHWWHFAKPAGALVVSVVFGLWVWIGLGDSTVEDVLSWVAIAAILGTAVWLVVGYVQWATTDFVVTSDRVIFRSGVFAKSGIEIPLDRVNNVISNQGILERFLGAGDLLIESGGETGQQRFTDVKNPERVQKIIHAQKGEKDARRYGGGQAQAAASGADVATQLEKLEGLFERGMISREEFDEQKRRLFEA